MRNLVIFTFVLLVGSAILGVSLISGNNEIDRATENVLESYEIIKVTEKLDTNASHFYFLIDNYLDANEQQLNKLKTLQQEALANLDELRGKIAHKEEQIERLVKIEDNLIQSIETLNAVQTQDRDISSDIDTARQAYMAIYRSFLDKEYLDLNRGLENLESKKDQFFYTLLLSVAIGTLLLFLVSLYLFTTQRKKSVAEKTLQDMEDRLALAFEGTDDGIFDWDIKTDKVYYSARFYSMLGFKHKVVRGTLQNFKDLLCPEDAERVWSYVGLYLKGKINEYNQEFRLKNADGEWVWINARAKGLFDDNGHCYRMVGAHTDISQSKRTQEILQSQKEEAEKANQAKSEFLANMSHEIRTPLTAISGIVEILLAKKEALETKHHKLIDTLNSSTTSLKDLINDILDFSKIESREIIIDNQYFALKDLFESVYNMMSMRAEEKGIKFAFNFDDVKDQTFYGDQVRFRQILINLIVNAIKFTDKGQVSVTAAKEIYQGKAHIRVDVADTGIGVEQRDSNVIFEKFKQGDASVSRRQGGTGLGLSISKNLANLMGGDIHLSWSEAGAGSVFTLELPIIDEKTVIPQHAIPETKENLNVKLRAYAKKGIKLLIVEDYEGSLVMLEYLFNDLNIDFDVAHTGLEAIQLWQDNRYDVILMDVQMPEMDGYTATKEIRYIEKTKGLSQTPIIGMTAHAMIEDRNRCIRAGMNSYLSKPVLEKDLKREIVKIIEAKKKAA